MLVVCPNCQTRYQLDDGKINGTTFSARCTKCKQVFSAYNPVQVEQVQFLDLDAARKNFDHDNIITVSNQKGGVAKTSTCLNLGLSLALHDKRVLLIDFDIQANLTISLGYKETTSFYDVLNGGGQSMEELIVETKYPNLYIFPSNKNMVLLNKKYFGAQHFEFILKDRLLALKERFDYIIIDTPPSIEFFTLNALTASHLVIIPSQCDYLSTHGIDQILKVIDLIKGKTNPFIESRVLITMFDKESTAAKMICTKLKQMYAAMSYSTIIELDPRIREAQIMSMPVLQYNQASKAGRQYFRLAEEILGMQSGNK
ncbi:MAG: AAA family ATPase [Desulfobacteraceae bacterium]|jgi:chromosome partitioning protein